MLNEALFCADMSYFIFFFNDTATTEIYTLSLHDALPIWCSRTSQGRSVTKRSSCGGRLKESVTWRQRSSVSGTNALIEDRKSTRLNSSHANISYAVFCLKKKKNAHCTSHVRSHDCTHYHL